MSVGKAGRVAPEVEEDTDSTDVLQTSDGGRYTRRQRRLRWVVLIFMSALGLLFLVWPVYELLFHL